MPDRRTITLLREGLRDRLGESGAAAVEFAMIAPLMLGFVFALFDLGLFLTSALLVQSAVIDAGRLVWTGQAQASADGAKAFQDAVCARISPLIACDAVTFDVRTFPTFTAITTGVTLDADGKMVSAGVNLGQPEEIVVDRVAYLYHFTVPLMGLMTGGSGSTTNLIVATGVFKNEPYGE